MLNALALGDTVVLDAYLKAHGIYDFVCRDHDDYLRSGDSMIRQLRASENVPIYRTYLKYPVPQAIKDELLHERMWEDSASEIMRLLICSGAKLEHFSTSCQDYKAPGFLAFMDTLGYDFHWISPTTGNNILMDYCACSDTPDQFKWERDAVISYLVKKGVRTDVRNQNGETAYDIARRSGLHPLLKEVEQMEQER